MTIADDGAGLPADFDVERQAGTGLRNVRSRLVHLYGDDAGFEIRGAGDAGTAVTMRIPLSPPERLARATA